jgi:hypothetical protein
VVLVVVVSEIEMLVDSHLRDKVVMVVLVMLRIQVLLVVVVLVK